MNEWYTSKELAGLPGCPASDRNIRILAEKGHWQKRKKVKGKGFEYHISSLPVLTQTHLRQQHMQQSLRHENAVNSAAQQQAQLLESDHTLAKSMGLITLNNLSDKARKKALAKLEVLKARQDFIELAKRKTEAEQQFDKLYNSGNFPISDATKAIVTQVNWRTLRRWQQVLNTQGVAALGGKYRPKATSVEQQAQLQQFLIALITSKPHLRNQAKALRENAELKAAEFGWKTPSESAIRRWAERWLADNRAAFISLTNPDAYNNQHRPLYGRMYPWLNSPNQIWEFDSTPTDVMLNADGKLRRYALVAAIDVYTRRPMVLVTPSSNSEGICLLLRRCLISWGMLNSDGIARTDNGSDYVSQRVTGIFDLLGCNQSRTRPFSGWEKPYIERFFGTLSRALFELLPGYIGHNVSDRQAIESAKAFAQRIGGKNKRQNEAELLSLSLTAPQLQDIIDQWIQHSYMHTVNDGFKGRLKGKTPFEVYTESGYVPKRIANPHSLDLLLNQVDDATVIRGSVKAGGIQYTAPELMESAWDRKRVRVFIDPSDVGRATLYSLEDWGSYVEAVNLDLVGRDIDPAAFRQARKDDKKVLASFRRAARELQDKFGIDTLAAEGLAKAAAERGNLTSFVPKTEVTDNPALAALSQSIPTQTTPSERQLVNLSRESNALGEAANRVNQNHATVMRSEHEKAEELTLESMNRALSERELQWLNDYRLKYRLFAKRLDKLKEDTKKAAN
ncbi:DDE-type integrase/transposase/recombinase [Shewanella algae]|uniref:DNA-binding protein n=1 Tax=Shewanella algae TaxID=38313 RepID=UPI001AAD1D8D|nr:DNA-binding protein [Shewanella algae]MBO2678436.1 DDE-type integrase/transposase/recombinase [Shewanella algae]